MCNLEIERDMTRFKALEDMSREELVREVIRTEATLEEEHSQQYILFVLHYLEDLNREFNIRDNKLKEEI